MNSTFTENDAGAQGGAIYQSANSLTIVNSTFVGNSSNEAGAIYFSGATAAIADSTISQNSAPTAGAIEAAAGTLTLTNNIVASNTFLSGGAIDNSATTNASYNVYFSNPGGGGTEVDCLNCTSNTNFVEATETPITPLGTYGGPTQTYLPQPLGGAICAGSAALVPVGTTTDQRGLPFDPLCATGAVDAGSVQSNYALSFATQPPANVTPATVFSPAPVVELTESGALASTVSGTVTITGSDWPIGGTTSVSLSSGTATFSNLTAADLTTGETLIAAIALNTTLTPPVSATTASDGIHVTRNDQTIGFTPIAFNQNVQTSIPLSATATSSLTVSFTSLTPATCTVSGTNASLNAYGFCTIEASQAGNIEIAPAPNVEQTIFIHHASQTISFPAIAFNQNAASTLPLEATATSGLAVTFASLTPATCTVSGATLNLNDYGFCTIQTSQNGNSVYGEAAHVEQTTFIHHLNQTISFGAITSQTVGSPLTLSATASSGLTVGFTSLTPSVCTVSGATATFLKAGTCTIEAAQSGNGVYGVAPAVKQSFKVNP